MRFQMKLVGTIAAVFAMGSVAAETIKVGIIGPFSGPFAHYGALFKAGAEAYVAIQGGKLAGKEVEFIYRDYRRSQPGQTKTLAQELMVKDKVDYLGGFVFTPNAFAVAPLIQQSQTPYGDLQRRHLGHHREVGVLRAHQLHAVAGDGADWRSGQPSRTSRRSSRR